MNSIEIFYGLKPYPLPEFGKFFYNLKKSAFRLELLSLYSIDDEEAVYKAYLAGGSTPPSDFNAEWIKILENARDTKKTFSRVRVIDGLLTNYLRFEIDWGYPKNIATGEDIKFLFRDEISFFKTSVPILKDFWLFDEEHCFLMEYDYYGRFLGVTNVPLDFISSYVDLMNEVKQNTITLDQIRTERMAK